MGAMTQMPRPKRIHVLLSKLFGGTMVFWMLWRAKHDWPDLLNLQLDDVTEKFTAHFQPVKKTKIGHKLLFELEDAEKAKKKEMEHH